MTQEQLDILCVNTQTEIGKEVVILKTLISKKDAGTMAYAIKLMHLHSLMRSIKDYDITKGNLTDLELFNSEAFINKIKNEQEQFFRV